MEQLRKLLKGKNAIAFLDLEGCEFTHELAALGAIVVRIDGDNGLIKRKKEPFLTYVRTKSRVGYHVGKLTGLTDFFLQKNGCPPKEAIRAFKEYVGRDFRKTLFVFYGNFDVAILKATLEMHGEMDERTVREIISRSLDFAQFFSQFAKDKNGNTLSLVHSLERLELSYVGTEHNPKDDAVNLMRLYERMLERPDLLLDSYKDVLLRTRHLPEPIREVLKLLAEKGSASEEQFEELIRKALR